jgi:hypothetical protein
MKTLNAILTISTVTIACTSLFFAMFQQFELMLISLSFSFFTSLFIKNN